MSGQYRGHSSWCDTHNKMAHYNRKLAKQAARRFHDSGLQEYRCDAIDGYWHVGHAPRAVKQGKRSNREHARRNERKRERSEERGSDAA
jgi:hypothetical protein